MSAAPDLEQLSGLFPQLAALLPQQRWFGDKQRPLLAVRPAAHFWLRRELPALLLLLVEVEFADGPSANYQLPLGLRALPHQPPEGALAVSLELPSSGSDPGMGCLIYDALVDPELCRALLHLLTTGPGSPPSAHGDQLVVRRLSDAIPTIDSADDIRPLALEQSNSSVVFAEELLLKSFRRVWPGVNPEVELLEALARAGFSGIAQPWVALEASVGGDTHSLGLLQSYLRNGSDGFTMALTSLRDLQADLLPDADGEVPTPEQCEQAVRDQGGSFLPAARQLGELTARMHLALASPQAGPGMAPRPLRREDLQTLAQRIEEQLDSILGWADPHLEPLAVRQHAIRALLQRLGELEPSGVAMRVHSDYHLGQLLRTDAGWHVLDFEGRPAEPVEVRSALSSPLRDMAGMLRSFDYAAAVALRQQAHPDEPTAQTLAPYGRVWARLMREAYSSAYLRGLAPFGLLPELPQTRNVLLSALEVAQALYEVEYELRSRPEWLSIPLEGIARLLQEVSP